MKDNGGITILECKDFAAFHHVPCCDVCHLDEDKLIWVQPPSIEPGYKRDWHLRIEAQVCCRMYDYVSALSHEWWEAKAIELGVKPSMRRVDSDPVPYKRDVESEPAVSHAETRRVTKLREWKQTRKVARTCLMCGEPSDSDVCEKCGG